jgi:hypothetical protein
MMKNTDFMPEAAVRDFIKSGRKSRNWNDVVAVGRLC